MQGRLKKWLGAGVAALLFVATPVLGGDNQLPYLTSDPGYASQGVHGQLVSNNMAAMNFEARITALEAALADKEEKSEWKNVSGEKWSGKVGGRIMGDYVMFANQDAQNLAAIGDQENYFEFRRLRIFLSGNGYGVYDYKFQLDLEPEFNDNDGTSIKDMYVGIHEIPLLGYVRLGNFYGPNGLEQNTSSKYITFMERSLPVIFAYDRKVGIASFKNSHDDVFHLNYGVFFHDIDDVLAEKVDDAQGVEAGFRAVWTPLYTANGRGVIHTGVSWRYVDDSDDSVRFRSRPETHEEDYWIDTGAIAARDYNITGLELAGIYGPFSVQSELYYTKINGMAGPDVDLYGAYVYGSWFLTGESRHYENENKIFGRVKPNTNFWIVPTCDGPCAGWGAWELAARWSYLDFTDPTINRGTLNDFTLGVNWHWNPYTRMMFNWIHPVGSDQAAGAGTGDILAMRWQVDF